MKEITRDWNWWAYFFRVIHRKTIPRIERYDDELVAFIVEALDLRLGERVLDLGCGSGVHALRLAQRGIQVVGLDVAPRLVEYATELAAQEGAEGATFVVGDMRDPQAAVSDQPFKAVIVLGTTFGFFDEAGNRAILASAARMLGPGGQLLLELTDPVMLMQPHETWWSEVDGGYLLMEAGYDPATCIRHGTWRYLDREGTMNLCAEPERIRVYSLPELRALLAEAGLPLRAAYGSTRLPPRTYGERHHERLIVVGRKAHPEFYRAHLGKYEG
jgi:SAM-dependent methyltransferase